MKIDIDVSLLTRVKKVLFNLTVDQHNNREEVEAVYNELWDAVQKGLLGYKESKPESPNDKNRYYIFGETFADHYLDGGIDNVMENLNDVSDIALFVRYPETTLEEFLDAYDGWLGHAEITEEEYEMIETKADTL